MEAFPADRIANALRQQHAGRKLASRQHHQKLLAAIAPYRIVAPYRRPHARRHLPQHRIPRHVAEMVVHRLEAIQVRHQCDQRFAAAARPRQFVLQNLKDRSAIPQSGEPVARGLLAQRLARLHQLFL